MNRMGTQLKRMESRLIDAYLDESFFFLMLQTAEKRPETN